MSASFVRADPCPPGHLRTHKLVRSPRPTYDDTHETSRAEYSASTKSHRDSDVSLKCSTSTPPVRDGFHRLDPSLNYRPLCTASQRSPIKPPRNRQQNLVQNPPPASRSRRAGRVDADGRRGAWGRSKKRAKMTTGRGLSRWELGWDRRLSLM